MTFCVPVRTSSAVSRGLSNTGNVGSWSGSGANHSPVGLAVGISASTGRGAMIVTGRRVATRRLCLLRTRDVGVLRTDDDSPMRFCEPFVRLLVSMSPRRVTPMALTRTTPTEGRCPTQSRTRRATRARMRFMFPRLGFSYTDLFGEWKIPDSVIKEDLSANLRSSRSLIALFLKQILLQSNHTRIA